MEKSRKSNLNELPVSFIEVRVKDIEKSLPLLGVCAGYEQEKWRAEGLAKHTIEWLPDFALHNDEIKNISSGNAVESIKKAAKYIFQTENSKNRGELGELLLHALIRQELRTYPLVHKLYYKSSPNNTVKGFDCVHITKNEENEYVLWLGEAKFYSDIDNAIRDVIAELQSHSKDNFLRNEFIAIGNKLEDIPGFETEKIKKLIHDNTSLDQIFDHIHIPVLLTYNSQTIKEHSSVTNDFKQQFKDEIQKHYQSFCKKYSIPLKIYLFLFPMECKQSLQELFVKKLEAIQSL